MNQFLIEGYMVQGLGDESSTGAVASQHNVRVWGGTCQVGLVSHNSD